MRLERSDLIGAACAALALGLIAWLSLDSWAITRCEEYIASGGAGEATGLSLDQARCLKRENAGRK
ncbi:MAG: hypothetical protein VR75_05400 [Hyphomonadaceae bacterium BRH_c29]|jgi:hypothetical protein|nr:MAG: hypothetical protein VR75_05400 [Hyphomonadaceae bacterium BRH_c29]